MKKSWFAIIAGVIILTGCATAGNARLETQTKESVSSMIKEGVTTKAQVQAALGDANSISFTDAGNEIWTYSFSRTKSKARNFIPYANIFSSGADTHTKEIVIFFKDNVVGKYTMRDTDTETRTGLVH